MLILFVVVPMVSAFPAALSGSTRVKVENVATGDESQDRCRICVCLTPTAPSSRLEV